MAQLRFRTGPQKGELRALDGGRPLILGRESKAPLFINDGGVSREHAEIFKLGEMLFVRDLGSRNGTFVNDERVQEELLRHGDVIRVGTTELVFEDPQTEEAGADVRYEEGTHFTASLDLKVDDLFLDSSGLTGGYETEHFRAICRATQLLHHERDEKRLFEGLLDLIEQYMPADHLYLFMRDPVSGLIIPRANRQHVEGGSVPISRTILKRVIQESRAILTADAMQDERFKTGDSIMMHHIRAVLCVPILNGPSVLGAIYAVNSRTADTFDQPDLELLMAIATQLGAALANLGRSLGRRRMLLVLLGRIIRLIEDRLGQSPGHAERVGMFASAVAREMALPDQLVFHAGVAGLLHDLVGQPAPAAAAAAADAELPGLLKGVPGLDDVWPMLDAQGERYDGQGTPKGLKGDAIPVGARILAVAHALEARLQGQASGGAGAKLDTAQMRKVFTEIHADAGKLFDPEAVRAAMEAFRRGTLFTAFKETLPPHALTAPSAALAPSE